MAGLDSPYVPGWDCHGLPIEIKVDGELGSKKAQMTPAQIRKACRAYAQKYVDLQNASFQRLGIFGRWDKPYLTMAPEYQAVIAGLRRLLRQGLRLPRPQARQLVHLLPHRPRRSRSRVREPHQPLHLRPLRA
jgi:isoleucyl-tRNA synthetase